MPDLVWKELSIAGLSDQVNPLWAENPAQARSQMERLVELMQKWALAGQLRVIRIPNSIVAQAPGYSLNQWRTDPLVDGLEPCHEAHSIYQRYVEGELTLGQMGVEIEALHDREYGPLSVPRNGRP